MKTNSRFVLIDIKAQKVFVYEGKVCLAEYDIDKTNPMINEDIEWARTQRYDSKA